MDGVVFAAGLGTRLAPLTDRMPKALVEVGGVAMLGRTARRLVAAGVDRLIVNVHAFPEQIERYVEAQAGFGIEVRLSYEREAPLETGGGLLAARGLLAGDAPFFVHNADVFTDLPLAGMYAAHAQSGALATLAVMERETTRALLFDEHGLLGRVDDGRGVRREVREARGRVQRLPFCGVHVISAEMPARISERGSFSILEPYLRLAAEGARILPFRVDGCTWVDIGRPAELKRARGLV